MESFCFIFLQYPSDLTYFVKETWHINQANQGDWETKKARKRPALAIIYTHRYSRGHMEPINIYIL